MAGVGTDEYIRHTAIDGERWDTLAWKYYADAARYEPILRANPTLRSPSGQWPTVPPVGAQLLIPVINMAESKPVEGLPPWVK